MKVIIFLCFIMISNMLKSQDINVLDFAFYEHQISKETKNKKPTIIYISTEWCSICRIQKQNINQDNQLVQLLNNDFLLVGLDAEKYTKDIRFLGKDYTYYPNGTSGLHELAYTLSEGTSAYPVWIFLDTKGNILRKIFGLISNKDFNFLLTEIKKLELLRQSKS